MYMYYTSRRNDNENLVRLLNMFNPAIEDCGILKNAYFLKIDNYGRLYNAFVTHSVLPSFEFKILSF